MLVFQSNVITNNIFAYRRTPPYPNCKEFVPRISLMLKKRYDIFFNIKDIKGIKDNIVDQLIP